MTSVSTAIRNFLARNYLISLLVLWSTLISASVASNLYQNQKDTVAKAKIEARTIFRHNIAYRKWSTMHGGIYTKITEKNKDNPHYLYNIDGSQKEVSFAIIDPSQVTKQAYEVLHNQAPNLAAISRTVSLDYNNTADPYDQPDAWESESLRTLEAGGVDETSTVATINSAPYLRLLTPYIIDRGCIKCHGHDFTIGNVRGGMSVAVPMQPYYETAVQNERTIIITHLLLWLLGCIAIVKFSDAFKKYRATIIDSERKFRIVSEFAYNFEYWLGQDDSLLFISPSCLSLTGYSREEFIGNPHLLETMIHPDDRGEYQAQINDADAHAFTSSPARIIKKDGEIRWFTHTVTPIYVDGDYLGRRGSSIDVTEQKKLEERLVHSKQLECLGQFAGGIAHDFNNVLGSINTFAHLLNEEIKGTDNATALDYIKYIKIATKLGKNLTSNLLSFGKNQLVEPQKTSLKKIIANISDILKSLVDESFTYVFNLTDDDYEIAADPHQLEQILINLCTNARDAMQGGGAITITTQSLILEHDLAGNLETIPADRYMVLSVSDNGHGIKPENIKKICEPFFTTKSSSKGTGLGLSIIFNIVKQHKAFMNVESVIRQGTTFSIFIKTNGEPFSFADPAAALDKNEALFSSLPVPDPSPQEVALEVQKPLRKKRILLADDDELIRKALQIQLERQGYQVLLADNGKSAIRLFLDQQETLDLTILDVIMPMRNGKEVYDIIRKNNPSAPVIFISGNTSHILSDEMIQQQGLHFLQKPVNFDALYTLIDRLIGPP